MFGKKRHKHRITDETPDSYVAKVTGEERASRAIIALSIYHEHQGETKYNRPYLDAYRGNITFEAADEAIILLAMTDAAAEMNGHGHG
jgi:hypothetical protein